MKIMKTLLTTVVLLLCIFAGTWTWYGGFLNVEPSIQQFEESFFVVNDQDINSVKVLFNGDTTESDLFNQVEARGAIPSELLICRCGIKEKYCNLSGLLINSDQLKELGCIGIKTNTIKISKGNSLYASFPYKGKLSKPFAIMRVYPALRLFCAKNGISPDYPIIEVVNVSEKRIEFCMLFESISEYEMKAM
jgi:hypothetical protein